MEKLIFPNSTISVRRVPDLLEILSGVPLVGKPCVDLFTASIKVDVIKSFSPTCHSCAIDDYEFDFNTTNPLGWDLQPVTVTNQADLKSYKQCNIDGSYRDNAVHELVEPDISLVLESQPEEDSVEYDDEFALDEEMMMHLGRPADFKRTSLGDNDKAEKADPKEFQPAISASPKVSTTSPHNSTSPSESLSHHTMSPATSEGDHPFVCESCGASFRVKGYLTRHLKKHKAKKPYQCPFFGKGDNGTKCHPTGGFCRRDTFKTHLKALHFIYPTGTKSGNRNDQPGRCAGCFKEFDNNNEWLESHIEANKCPAMVRNYK